IPSTAVAGMASSTPAVKEPVSCTKVDARKAPSMYSEPCARLIMSMMPKTSVRPAASRNSIRPNCSPLSDCSAMRIQLNSCLLHLAVLHVRIAVVLEHRAEDLVVQAALRVLRDHAQVVVLDRHRVAVDLDRAPHRLELRRLHRLAYRLTSSIFPLV